MGPGPRFCLGVRPGIGFGIYLYDWPFDYVIHIDILCLVITIGLGDDYVSKGNK